MDVKPAIHDQPLPTVGVAGSIALSIQVCMARIHRPEHLIVHEAVRDQRAGLSTSPRQGIHAIERHLLDGKEGETDR